MDAKVDQPARGLLALQVLEVSHYTGALFSFRTVRPDGFRFRSGEFTMIGLADEQRPLLRAYSIASPNWDDTLEFYSIKVPGGPLTSRLQNIRPGDDILLRPKPVGTLVIDALLPGERLILLATGTGIAPFASIIRDPETYEKFGAVYLMHTVRTVAELRYGAELMEKIETHEILGEMCRGRLNYLPATTRETSANMGRIGTWIEDGRFAAFAGGQLTATSDRVMICGSMPALQSLKTLCETFSFVEGSNSSPGSFVIEKAFVG